MYALIRKNRNQHVNRLMRWQRIWQIRAGVNSQQGYISQHHLCQTFPESLLPHSLCCASAGSLTPLKAKCCQHFLLHKIHTEVKAQCVRSVFNPVSCSCNQLLRAEVPLRWPRKHTNCWAERVVILRSESFNTSRDIMRPKPLNANSDTENALHHLIVLCE